MITYGAVRVLVYAHGLCHTYGHTAHRNSGFGPLRHERGISTCLIPVYLDERFYYRSCSPWSTAGVAPCRTRGLFPSCMSAAFHAGVVANLAVVDVEHVPHVLRLTFGNPGSFRVVAYERGRRVVSRNQRPAAFSEADHIVGFLAFVAHGFHFFHLISKAFHFLCHDLLGHRCCLCGSYLSSLSV